MEGTLPRFRLKIEYDGRGFVGWQRQDNGFGVQHALEDAIRGFSGESVYVQGAGRTDSGVHALGQVAHIDLKENWSVETIRDALNAHLKGYPVSVLDAVSVEEGFHARFSAVQRLYKYRIINRRAPLTVDAGRAWWVPQPLDVKMMDDAARILVGTHDFTSFRASECQAKSPVKTLENLTVGQVGEVIEIAGRARSFLHHQIRNIVGSLVWVGGGKWTSRQLEEALRAKDRRAGGPTAPAEGLYLISVFYPEDNSASDF